MSTNDYTPQQWEFGGASQGTEFLRCQSKWWLNEVCRLGYGVESTTAQLAGSAVHKVVEVYLETAEMPTQVTLDEDTGPVTLDVTEPMKQAALRLLTACPPPKVNPQLIEMKFVDDELAAPVQVRGTVDLVDPRNVTLPDGRTALRVVDHKTTSHLKWAPLSTEVKAKFQACVYTAHIAVRTGWKGPILFVFNYVERGTPYRHELREAVFEPADVAEAIRWVGEVMLAMQGMAMATRLEDVPYNTDACSDFASKANPEGCPHRMRCAAVGRETMGAMSYLFHAMEMPVMSDPLTALLAQAGTPAAPPPQPAANDDARKALKAKVWAIDPEVVIGDADDVNALFKAAAEKQTRLMTEVATLMGDSSPENLERLREHNTVELTGMRASLTRPKPVAEMNRAELEAEVVKLQPDAAPFLAKYTDDKLREAIDKLRPDAQGDAHAINSPENIPDTTSPTTATDAKASAPKAPRTGKGRGIKLPLPQGDKLLSKCTKNELRWYIVSHKGLNYPRGKGATGRAREMCKVLVTGSLSVEGFGPFEGSEDATPSVVVQKSTAVGPTETPATASQPAAGGSPSVPLDETAAAQLRACQAEIEQLGTQLGVQYVVGDDIPTVVTELQRLRALRDEKAAEALELPPGSGPVSAVQVGDKRIEYHPPNLGNVPGPGKTGAFELFVNCRPDSGADDLAEAVALIGPQVAKAKQVPHWLAVPYNEGGRLVAAMLCTQVKAGRIDLPGQIYVNTRTALGAALADALGPMAARITRGDS